MKKQINIVRINLDEFSKEELNQLSKTLHQMNKTKEATSVEVYVNTILKD